MTTKFIKYLTTLAAKEGEIYATRFLQEHNKLRIRDGNSDLLEIPSNCTQRSLYIRFCYKNGWKVQVTAQDNFEPTS